METTENISLLFSTMENVVESAISLDNSQDSTKPTTKKSQCMAIPNLNSQLSSDGISSQKEVWAEDNKPLEESMESPIHSFLARKILEEFFSENSKKNPILEFRRKKVIKFEEHKFMFLLKGVSSVVREKKKAWIPEKSGSSAKSEMDRKNTGVRRVKKYWSQKTTQFPAIFKKTKLGICGTVFELHDLMKCQQLPKTQTNLSYPFFSTES